MEGITNSAQETSTLPPISDVDIVRAWRDPKYRRSLSAEQLQMLPPGNPAGPTDLTGDELKASGFFPDLEEVITTARDCTLSTFNHWKACGCPN